MALNTPRRRAAASYAKEFLLGNSNITLSWAFQKKEPSGLLIRSAHIFRVTLLRCTRLCP